MNGKNVNRNNKCRMLVKSLHETEGRRKRAARARGSSEEVEEVCLG